MIHVEIKGRSIIYQIYICIKEYLQNKSHWRDQLVCLLIFFVIALVQTLIGRGILVTQRGVGRRLWHRWGGSVGKNVTWLCWSWRSGLWKLMVVRRWLRRTVHSVDIRVSLMSANPRSVKVLNIASRTVELQQRQSETILWSWWYLINTLQLTLVLWSRGTVI